MRELLHSLIAPEARAFVRALAHPDAVLVGIIYVLVWTLIVLTLVWSVDWVTRRAERRQRDARELERIEAIARIEAAVREAREERFQLVRGA